jgi:hypothetical protein
MTQINFDARQVAPDQGRLPPLPTGWYVLAVVSTEVKPTSSGNGGTLLAYQAEVKEGPGKGRRVFGNFNIQNPNPQATEIGLRQLSAMCHATGQLQLQDTSQLHDKPFRGRLKYVPAEGQYDAKNELVAMRHMSEQVPEEPPAPAPVASAPTLAMPSAAALAQPWAPQAHAQAPAPAMPAAQPWQQPQGQQPWQQPGQPAAQPPVYQPPAQQPQQQPAQASQQAWAPMQQQPQAQAPAQPWQQPQGAGAPAWAQAPAQDPGTVAQPPAQQAQQPQQPAQNPNPATPPWAQQ